MSLNDWLILTSIGCMIIGTIYVAYTLKKVIASIELKCKEVEKQRKQIVFHRLKEGRS